MVPISGGLGLADVRVSGLASPDKEPIVLLPQFDPGPGRIRVRMARDHTGDWVARIAISQLPRLSGDHARTGSELNFSVEVLHEDTVRTFGPYRASAAPGSAITVTDWALGAVWYQVFPERFANGEPANDPRPPLVPDVVHKAWLSDWDAVTADELELNRALAAGSFPPRTIATGRRSNLLQSVVLNRRYGGDLQGLVERLDHLAELGVTAIYLNPIFHAHSLHKYDATDFRHIDPTLAWPGTPDLAVPVPSETADPATWTWTPADRYFLDVVLPECHRRGICVVLDGVWNHVGTRFWAFQNVQQNGAGSPYAAWFQPRIAPADPAELGAIQSRWTQLAIGPGSLMGWSSWNGRNGSLPIFARAASTSGTRLHPEVEAHIFAVTRRWMDPNGDGDPSDGIDGWRLDVAPDVPIEFWKAWRQHVRQINPNAVLVGEIWPDAAAWFNGVAFDGQTNYPFAMPVVRWLEAGSTMTSDELGAALSRAFAHAPLTDLIQMNLLASHDTERVVSMLANPGRSYDQSGSPASNPQYSAAKPSPEIYRLALLGVAMQATYPGSPMVYYGDEWGMHGADDPHCRKPLPWPDLGSPLDPADAPDASMLTEYRRWLSLRQDPRLGPLLRFGDVTHLESNNPDVFAFRRRLNGDAALVVLNRGSSTYDAAPLMARAAQPADAAPRVPPHSAVVMLEPCEGAAAVVLPHPAPPK